MRIGADHAQMCLTTNAQMCKIPGMSETMLEKTKQLARELDIPQSVICQETGLKPRWLAYLLEGRYEDPGVNKIERLHAYLLSKQKEGLALISPLPAKDG